MTKETHTLHDTVADELRNTVSWYLAETADEMKELRDPVQTQLRCAAHRAMTALMENEEYQSAILFAATQGFAGLLRKHGVGEEAIDAWTEDIPIDFFGYAERRFEEFPIEFTEQCGRLEEAESHANQPYPPESIKGHAFGLVSDELMLSLFARLRKLARENGGLSIDHTFPHHNNGGLLFYDLEGADALEEMAWKVLDDDIAADWSADIADAAFYYAREELGMDHPEGTRACRNPLRGKEVKA